MFLPKVTLHCLGPKYFYKRSDSIHFPIFMLENIRCYNVAWGGPNSQEIVGFVPIMNIQVKNWIVIKFIVSCVFILLLCKISFHVKLWYLTFTSMKMDGCIEFELLGIFPVKLVAKNMALVLPRIHYRHMRFNK